MTVHVTQERGASGVDGDEVARRARVMMRALGCGRRELSIVLTGDRQIQKLNRLYRNKDKPTDVLSFPLLEGEDSRFARHLLGDVVIAIPTARRQAMEKGVGLMEEVTELLAHGLLHLLGWDHDTDAKDRRMRRETARLCRLTNKKTQIARPVTRRAPSKKRPA